MDLPQLTKKFSQLGGGLILRKQTTYVDIVGGSETFRINYQGKREFRFATDNFKDCSLHDEHPLLMDYLEPVLAVHLVSPVANKPLFREVLESAIGECLGKWRNLDGYLNLPLEKFLERPYGILMWAPASFAQRAATKAGEIGVELILHDGHKDTGKPTLILMDENFVIADDFKVAVLSSGEKI